MISTHEAHSPYNFYVRSSGTITWGDRIHHSQDVSLNHTDKIQVIFTLGHITQVFDEVHDICPIIHRVLEKKIFSLENKIFDA